MMLSFAVVLMMAVKVYTNNPLVILYNGRWLTTPVKLPDGSIIEHTVGTPQGGEISPMLDNLFQHYANVNKIEEDKLMKVVAAQQRLASEAGRSIFREGGNAADVAIAAGFVQVVVDPQMCGLGGFGCCLVSTREGENEFIDFMGKIPGKMPADAFYNNQDNFEGTGIGGSYNIKNFENQVGYKSVLVPGTVAGLWELYKRYGKLPWKALLMPAIAIAKHGFPVPPYLYNIWNEKPEPGYIDTIKMLSWTPASKKIYTREGRLIGLGKMLFQAEMANTLEIIAYYGGDSFYQGDIADIIDQDFKENNGFISKEDLGKYSPKIFEPDEIQYGDFNLMVAPPPVGGCHVAQLLNIIEQIELKRYDFLTSDYIEKLAQAMYLVFLDRAKYWGDPDYVNIPVEKLLSKWYAKNLYDKINQGFDFEPITQKECPGTTHLSVVDDNMAIALTHTQGTASGVVTPGLGFMYNNGVHLFNPIPGYPNSIEPGKRRISAMSPSIIKNTKHVPVGVIGASGGTRIITGVAQTINNLLEFELSPLEAISAPRIHCEGETIWLEGRINKWVEDDLRERGYKVIRRIKEYDSFFSLVQLVWPGKTFNGAADMRLGGGMVCVD